MWKWLRQLRQSRCPVSHGWVGSQASPKAFPLLTPQPCLGTGGWEAHRALPSPVPGPWQLLHDSALFQRGSLKVIPGPELFRLAGFASSPVLREMCCEKLIIPMHSHSFFFTVFPSVKLKTNPGPRYGHQHLPKVMNWGET